MRIFLLTQYFAPEVTAARARVELFARSLSERGHDVVVICEVPNHPEGVVREGYRNRIVVKRDIDGIDVRHVWVYATPKKSSATRMLFYGTYAAMATAVGVALPRPDVVLVSSPPLPAAAAAALVARRHRVPWVFDVRDLWPEAAVVLGELTNPRLVTMAERLESRLYESADAIVTVTEPFKRKIEARTSEIEKISLLPNGTTREWLKAGQQTIARSEAGLPEDGFLWMYAGNMGIAQGLETAVEAAGLLGDGFTLVCVGQGPKAEALRQQASVLPSGSVTFTGLVEAEEAMRLMRAADALLVPLADQPALDQFVPSKLFDCCAIGRPTIVSAGGEASRLAGEAGAGIIVAPGDAPALAEAVRTLSTDRQLRERLSREGRAFAAAHLREDGIDQLETLLKGLARR